MQSIRRSKIVKSSIKSIVANPADADLYNGGVSQIVDNGNQQENKSMPLYEGLVPDYIIITSRDAYNGGIKSEFERLADWKNKKGVPTLIAYTEDIAQNYQGVDLQEKIRNYLKDMYVEWASGLFVLLGGDINIVPARNGFEESGQQVTDLYYGDVFKSGYTNYNWNSNGDCNFTDIEGGSIATEHIIGRAPVENSTEAQVFVNKILTYERLKNNDVPVSNPDYVQNVLLLAAHAGTSDDFTSQKYWMGPAYLNNIPDYIQGTTWRIYDDYNAQIALDNDYEGNEELCNQAVVNALNNSGNFIYGNFHIVAHIDHGNPYRIGTSDRHKQESLTFIEAGDLTNTSYFQILFTAACDPNQFQKDCFGERYLNNPNGGGVAFIGNTGSGSFGDQNQVFYLFNSIYNIGGLYDYGYYLGNAFSSARDIMPYDLKRKKLNLLGDPEMPIWTATPTTMNFASNPVFNSTTNTVTATIGGLTAGVELTLCVYKENEVIAFATVTTTGAQQVFSIINVNPNTSGNLYVTATAHNYFPLEYEIPITITGKHLYSTARTFNDDSNGASIGNNDGKPDAGETIEMYVTLTNSGTVTAQNISATLSCLTEDYTDYLTINTNTASFPNVSSGQTGVSLTPYLFTIENDIEETRRMHFKLEITADGGYTAAHDFYFDIYMPEIISTDKNIISGTLSASQTVTFNIKLSNKGNAAATGIIAELYCNDADVSSYDQTQHTYADIDEYSEESATVPFTFTIDSGYTSSNSLEFTVNVENEYGKTWSENFNLAQIVPTITDVSFKGGTDEITVNWQFLSLSTISGYNYYRSPADANGNDLGQYEKQNVIPLRSSFFTDKGLDELTVYYYQVAAVSLDGIEGQHTGIKAWTSYPLMEGWPVNVVLTSTTSTGTCQAVDMDGDNKLEVFAHKFSGTKGQLLGLRAQGEELYDIDHNNTPQYPMANWLDEDVRDLPAIADLDNDGVLEIVSVSGWDATTSSLTAYSLIDADVNDEPLLFFDISLPNTDYFKGPVISDLNHDGAGEIVIKSVFSNLLIMSNTGSIVYSDPSSGRAYGRVAISDVDNNGYKEIFIGLDYPSVPANNGFYKYYFNGSGWVKTTLITNSSRIFGCSPVIADFDDNGTKEILVMSYNNTSGNAYLNILNPNGTYFGNWSGNLRYIPFSPDDYIKALSGLAVGDLDNNPNDLVGKLEIVAMGDGCIKIWKSSGDLLTTVNNPAFNPGTATPILADVDEDEDIEIVFADGTNLNAINYDGTQVLGFPIVLPDCSTNSDPLVADIDNDGFNEVLINQGLSAYVWKTEGKSSRIEWGSIRSNCANTGEYFDYCQHSTETITVNSDEEWVSRKVNSDVIVNSGKTLTILPNSEILFQPDVNITVEGALIVEAGASLGSSCDDTWNGNITVQNGGNIVFKENSSVEIGGDGILKVLNSNPVQSVMDVYSGTSIILADSDTKLEVAGNLNIHDNAQFTFTGNGYVKFSNPGPDATNNIFCGSGSSFVLQGSGQNDKIMEVQQKTVHFPGGIDKVELRNGKIEMGSNCRLQNDITTGDEETILNNIKITSDNGIYNGHRGFAFWGQQNVSIENCTFEYGKYGINANNTYWGAALTVSGSNFIENQTGLYVYNKGVHLNNCHFTNNTETAVKCEAMSFESDLYRTNIFSNYDGIIYHSSNGSVLNVAVCEIQNNNNNGISTSGYFGLDLKCTYVKNNFYGIYTEHGTRVIIDNSSRNDISGNNSAIYLNYGLLYANNGLNRFTSSNYAVKGETILLCLPGLSPVLNAENNTWDSENNSPEFMVNHKLYVLNCDYTPVNIIDNNPTYLHCFHITPWPIKELCTGCIQTENDSSQVSDLPVVSISDNQSIPIDEAVQQLYCQAEQLQSETGYQNLIHDYINLLQDLDIYTSSQVLYWKNKAWHDMHIAVNNYFDFVKHDTENAGFNQSLNDVMLLNETLMQNPYVSQIGYYEYFLDNALLERLRENYNKSLTMLESLKFDIPEMDREIAYVNRWQCYIEAEREAKLGNLSPDAFMAAIQDCSQTYESTMEDIHVQDSLNNRSTEQNDNTGTPAPKLTIIPNPNTGNFTIEVYCEVPNSEIKITNAFGQHVRTMNLTDDGQQSLQVTGLVQGQYTVYYIENGAVLDSENMVVK